MADLDLLAVNACGIAELQANDLPIPGDQVLTKSGTRLRPAGSPPLCQIHPRVASDLVGRHGRLPDAEMRVAETPLRMPEVQLDGLKIRREQLEIVRCEPIKDPIAKFWGKLWRTLPCLSMGKSMFVNNVPDEAPVYMRLPGACARHKSLRHSAKTGELPQNSWYILESREESPSQI